MSSSYYVNALFSKYTAGASLFQNAEPTSCSFAPNSQRSGYGAGAGAFASTVPGLYNVNSPLYQSPFASGYGLGADAYGNLPCASYDQNIPGLCSDLAKGACDKADEGALHGPAEANFRIYPWMRSSAGRAKPFIRAPLTPLCQGPVKGGVGNESGDRGSECPRKVRGWGRGLLGRKGAPGVRTARGSPTCLARGGGSGPARL
ncbi:homeobox protein Hox-A7 isoform X2 [Mirounga leonina]|uniref:Homeobox protein Hox-A7 isoform X2 n=1 Tax=Leptonychotes weddellii TaxID=9713 RepID=A0A7F8QRG9_LEPWE|nr:homeobox protein Hox-A7 isoform X2 [Leptonychotes weddellii]XP_034876687.1 homeobox protein Hox-A7 isoform X2 [Mirounga leonina]XP_045720484.1 homeobox protein Hox-A7 isoform X2 [Mirounga angustirostris]